jgi:hypothetical protein
LKNFKDVLLAGKDDNASAAEGVSEKAQEDEIESLTGILGDLEKKVSRIDSVHLNKQLMLSIYPVS